MKLAPNTERPLRVGAVNYLNSKPLVWGLSESPGLRLLFDLPSRLADSLAAARLDVALVPTVEHLRAGDYQIVSDACVASRDEVRSVKLYFRTHPERVATLALDEGSRTSAALAQVLLAERYGRRPALAPLPIGAGPETADTDAVLVIGDRAMFPPSERFVCEWDLGAEWRRETGLPFVFACWSARAGVDAERVAPALAAARDAGLARVDAIAREEAAKLGLEERVAHEYLTTNLHYRLGEEERAALGLFARRLHALGLLDPVPAECSSTGVDDDPTALSS